jgi:hypothetical protein
LQQTLFKNKVNFVNNSNERVAFLNPNGSVGFTNFQATTANTEGAVELEVVAEAMVQAAV